MFVGPGMNRNWAVGGLGVLVGDCSAYLSADAFTMPFTIFVVFPSGRAASSDL